MGVDGAGLALLALARRSGADFTRTVTIGRQEIHLPPEKVVSFFAARGRADIAARVSGPARERYCEGLLKVAFGAATVDSIDAAAYEQATIIHDMNAPLAVDDPFSVVADFGTLEHVMNVATALDNVAALCAPQGHILHVLPANNQCGHGFYQFSPALFFQVYSPARGYAGTRAFMVRAGDPSTWYEISPPIGDARVEITSPDAITILVMSQKIGDARRLEQEPVQQSDYEAKWARDFCVASDRPRTRLMRRGEQFIRDAFVGARTAKKMAKRSLRRRRSDVTAHSLRTLIPDL